MIVIISQNILGPILFLETNDKKKLAKLNILCCYQRRLFCILL